MIFLMAIWLGNSMLSKKLPPVAVYLVVALFPNRYVIFRHVVTTIRYVTLRYGP